MNQRDIELAEQNFVTEIANAIEKCVKAAVETEREACALMADDAMFVELGDAIRARGTSV